MTTYVAELHSPLFYSGSEGALIRVSRILSSTALSYALGYSLGLLKKRYLLYGEEASQHNYEELATTGLCNGWCSLHLVYTEEMFRSVEYLQSGIYYKCQGKVQDLKDQDLDLIKKKKATINKVRRYVGLAPGSRYSFSVWSPEPLPDGLLLTMGIRRSGEFRLKRHLVPLRLSKSVHAARCLRYSKDERQTRIQYRLWTSMTMRAHSFVEGLPGSPLP